MLGVPVIHIRKFSLAHSTQKYASTTAALQLALSALHQPFCTHTHTQTEHARTSACLAARVARAPPAIIALGEQLENLARLEGQLLRLSGSVAAADKKEEKAI